MDLALLRCFAAAAAHETFSAAAKALGTNQPTLSRQIQSLEAQVGTPLFDRIGRGVSLTPAGEELLGFAQLVLQNVDLLMMRAREFAEGSHAKLRIGATPQTIESFLSPLLAGFRANEPGLQFSLFEDNSDDLLQRVETGEIHIAISSTPRRPPLTGRPVYPLVSLAVVPRNHPLSRRKHLEIADLVEENLIVFGTGFMTRQLLDAACALEGFHPRILLESRNSHILLRLAEDGLGIAVVPSTLMLDGVRQAILPLQHRGSDLSLWMSLVWDSRRTLPPIARDFIDYAERFARKNYPGRTIPAVRRIARAKPRVPSALFCTEETVRGNG